MNCEILSCLLRLGILCVLLIAINKTAAVIVIALVVVDIKASFEKIALAIREELYPNKKTAGPKAATGLGNLD